MIKKEPVLIKWAASCKEGPWHSCDVIEEWRHIFAVKKLTRVCLKKLSVLQIFWQLAKTSKQCKIVIIITTQSLQKIIFSYTRKYTFACGYVNITCNDAAGYTLYSSPHKNLILTANVLMFFTNLSENNVHSEKRKISILIKIPRGPSLRDAAQGDFYIWTTKSVSCKKKKSMLYISKENYIKYKFYKMTSNFELCSYFINDKCIFLLQ